jgi:hypothetical protein
MSMTVDIRPRWAGTPLAAPHWLESPSGFPSGGVAETGLGAPDEVLATVGRWTLTRRQVDEVVAFAELLAGRAFPEADRAELAGDLVDAFEDSPVSTAGFLRPLSGAVTLMSAMSPVERAVRRLRALTTTWLVEQHRVADGEELGPVMVLVHRHNPLVRHWATTGVVIVADTFTSRFEQHRLVLSLIGREAEAQEALADRLRVRLECAGPMEAAELAAAQVRLMCIRAWLRDIGETALGRLVGELEHAVPSALDVDIVVQQVGFRAAMEVAPAVAASAPRRRHRPPARGTG